MTASVRGDTHTHTQIRCIFNQVPSHYPDRKTDLGLDCEKLAISRDLKELAAWKTVFSCCKCAFMELKKKHVKGNAMCVQGWFGLQAPRKIESMWTGICVNVRHTFRKPWTVFVWSLWCVDWSERVSLFISPSKHATAGLRELRNNAAKAPEKPPPEGTDSLSLTHHPVRSEGTQSLPALSTFTFSNQSSALVLMSFIQAQPQHTVLPLFPLGCCRRRCVDGICSC